MDRTPKQFSVRILGTVLAVLFLLGSGTVWAEATLKVGAFNIQIFGETKVGRPHVLEVLAKIATNYDLLAIEEVGSNGSTATEQTCIDVMNRYVKAINEADGSSDFTYVRGNQYALVFRTSKLRVSVPSVYSGSQHFTYMPLTAFFTAINGNLDFSVIVIHTSPSQARVEIPALKDAMAEVALANKDPDVVVMGDFNGDGTYFSEGKGRDLSGFPGDQYISAISNDEDTTVAKSSNTYDRIEMTISMKSDYVGTSGVVQFDKLYDLSKAEGTSSTTGTAAAISDHYPVWTEVWDNRDTD